MGRQHVPRHATGRASPSGGSIWIALRFSPSPTIRQCVTGPPVAERDQLDPPLAHNLLGPSEEGPVVGEPFPL
jgi:hypothetical protein